MQLCSYLQSTMFLLALGYYDLSYISNSFEPTINAGADQIGDNLEDQQDVSGVAPAPTEPEGTTLASIQRQENGHDYNNDDMTTPHNDEPDTNVINAFDRPPINVTDAPSMHFLLHNSESPR